VSGSDQTIHAEHKSAIVEKEWKIEVFSSLEKAGAGRNPKEGRKGVAPYSVARPNVGKRTC